LIFFKKQIETSMQRQGPKGSAFFCNTGDKNNPPVKLPDWYF